MKKSKAILMVVCAMLLVAASVMGTLAYLTSQASVTNTFSVGKVAITMDEAKVNEYGEPVLNAVGKVDRVDANTYKLVPGHKYKKDPTIHVQAKSENCWVFVKIENGLGADATLENMNPKFKPLWVDNTLVDGVYYYENIVPYSVNVTDLVVFDEFTFANDADPDDYKNASIKVTGYAIQADGFGTAKEAWEASGFGTAASTPDPTPDPAG